MTNSAVGVFVIDNTSALSIFHSCCLHAVPVDLVFYGFTVTALRGEYCKSTVPFSDTSASGIISPNDLTVKRHKVTDILIIFLTIIAPYSFLVATISQDQCAIICPLSTSLGMWNYIHLQMRSFHGSCVSAGRIGSSMTGKSILSPPMNQSVFGRDMKPCSSV